MTEKTFDVIGIGHPCVDYLLHIDSLPRSNESRYAREGSWQCGGKVTTGLVAASRCGLSCALIGAMGDDLFGRYCYRDFELHGINLSQAKMREGSTTDIGVVLSEEETNGRNIFYRRGSYERIRQDEVDLPFLERGQYLFLALADELHVAAARYAKEHGVKVLIDADSRPMDEYEEILPWVDYFVASEFVYKSSFSDCRYREHMEEILRKGPSASVFTFGSKGCRGLSEEGYFELPAFRVPVVDTVGAGDTFHGAFFYGLRRGLSLEETARFASAVSAVKCTCIGGRAGIPTPDIAKKFMETGIIDDASLRERVARYSWGLDDFFREVMEIEKKKNPG